MATRTLTALYDSRDAAEAAKDQLKTAGVDAVDIHNEDAGDGLEGAARAAGQKTRGLLDRLGELFGGHHDDAHAYAEGVRRGHYLLTARVDDDRAQAASTALNASGAVDFDQAQDSWRAEGWAPGQRAYDQGASTVSSTYADDTRGTAGVQPLTGAAATGAAAATAEDFGQPASDTAQIQPEIPAQTSAGYTAASTAATGPAGLDAPSSADATSGFGQPASTGAQVQPQTSAETAPYAQGSSAGATTGALGGDAALERVTDGDTGPARSARREDDRSNAFVRSYVADEAAGGGLQQTGSASASAGAANAETAGEGLLRQDTTVRDTFQPRADAAHDLDQGLPRSDIQPGGSLNRPA